MIFCRRTLHLCNRYPFRLLAKSVSAVSGRDIIVVKLLLYFLCVLFSLFYGFDLLFVLFFVCLFVCMLFFLFSVSVKELIAVNSLAVNYFPHFFLCLLLR